MAGISGPLPYAIAGIRKSIPSGYILGRTATGDGPAHLIPISQFKSQLLAGTATNSSLIKTLAALSDVSITSPAGLQVLQYNVGAGKWENAYNTIANLHDVILASPANGDILQYNSTAGAWENGTPTSANFTLPTGTGSSTAKTVTFVANNTGFMAGMAYSYTPTKSTTLLVVMATQCSISADCDTFGYMTYGTGTAPANGAALTGTGINAVQDFDMNKTADGLLSYTAIGILTGLTVGTAYWFDWAAHQGTGTPGTLSMFGNTIKFIELGTSVGAIGGGGSSTLAGDTDVSITSPANNDVLTYDSASSKWKNKPASGGGGGSPPIVQTATYASDASVSPVSVTFGAAPTAGNMLVAIYSHFNNAPGAQTGWTILANQNGGVSDGWGCAYKQCGVGESTTQTPVAPGSGQGFTMCVWELGPNVLPVSLFAFNLSQTLTGRSSVTATIANSMANAMVLAACEVQSGTPNTPTLDAALTLDATVSSTQRILKGAHASLLTTGAKSYTCTMATSQNFALALVMCYRFP